MQFAGPLGAVCLRVKAVLERTGGKRLQVDFGKDETALVHLWQIVEKVR
jgi:hypothetical protein